MPNEYRVIRTEQHDGGFVFAIRKVVVKEDGEVVDYDADDAYPRGTTLEEMCADLRALSEAVLKPVLENPLREEDWEWDASEWMEDGPEIPMGFKGGD